jgi:hypothetical protein
MPAGGRASVQMSPDRTPALTVYPAPLRPYATSWRPSAGAEARS